MVSPAEGDPCTPVRIRAEDDARLIACAHGGQLLAWTPAGEDRRDRLWLSPLAQCAHGETVRGGIPIVFPQFSDRGRLPPHGLARDRAWELDTGSDGAPVARVTARLRDDAFTRAIWPHRFTLTLLAEAAGRDLTLTLTVRNDAPPDGAPFTMTAALHAYLSVDARRGLLTGLGGLPAKDNTAGGAAVVIPDGPLPAEGPVDLAVSGTRGPITLDDGLDGRLELRCEDADGFDGFDGFVVWNPGHDHGLADVPPHGHLRFLCVEPAHLTPVSLEPQRAWRGKARLTALVP